MAFLEIRESTTSEGQGREVDLGPGETVAGRAGEADLALTSRSVSRRHAAITATTQGYVIRDLGSANGTWVNGKKVADHLLRDADEIWIGEAVLIFREPPDLQATVLVDTPKVHGAKAPEPRSAVPGPRPRQPDFPHGPTAPGPPPVAHAQPPRRVEAPPPRGRSPRAAPPPAAVALAQPRARPATPILGPERRYAGFWIRLLAYMVDVLILGLFVGGLTFALGLASASLARELPALPLVLLPIQVALATIVPLLYVLIPWARSGATLGKRVCGLKIVREDGSSLGLGTAFLRLIGYVLSGMVLYVGFVMVAFTDRKRGLHDMIAGTVVVRDS